MTEYIAEIKEKGKCDVLRSSIYCEEKSIEELIAFWGLKEQDVEWYKLYQLIKEERNYDNN